MEYNLVYPQSQKASYGPSDVIDFLLTFAGKSIVRNSIRLSGVLNVYATTNPNDPVNAQRIYYDATVGIHSFLNNVVVSTQKQGILENQSDYGRYVKMKNNAFKTDEQMITSGNLLNDLTMTDSTLTNKYMTDALPFYTKPDICFNNATGNIDNSKTGDVKISLRLSNVLECLFGPDITPNATYQISSLALEYRTTAEMKQPITMVIKQSAKQVVNSTNSTINIQLPAVVYSVCSSFMRVAEELQLTFNNLATEQPPNITKLYYSFNNTTGQYIGYPIESLQDMLQHYIESFHAVDGIVGRYNDNKNNMTNRLVNDNQAFGIGLDFSDSVSLMTANFGVNLLSGVQSDDPYYIWLFFHSIANL